MFTETRKQRMIGTFHIREANGERWSCYIDADIPIEKQIEELKQDYGEDIQIEVLKLKTPRIIAEYPMW